MRCRVSASTRGLPPASRTGASALATTKPRLDLAGLPAICRSLQLVCAIQGGTLLRTSLAGRVRNTSLPKSHSLLPVHEAVVNAIQAIDQRCGDDITDGAVTVRIVRSPQEVLETDAGPGRTALPPIVGFEITDNGVGFNDENLRSFETLDSDHKSELGCRGVGRLLWLKAFARVEVTSQYVDSQGKTRSREFEFTEADEVRVLVDRDTEPVASGTVVTLDGFKAAHQAAAPKTGEAIARDIAEHCIWYFLRPGGAPTITVVDDEAISLQGLIDDLVDHTLTRSSFEVNGTRFEIVNLALKPSAKVTAPRLNWCAANRVVTEETITSRIPGLVARMKDDSGGEFTYVGYLMSDFLDEHVRSDRTAFDLSEGTDGEVTFAEVTLQDIRDGALAEIQKLLAEPLDRVRDAGRERLNDFVSRTAPRYRPVLARIEQLGITVDPSMKNAELESLLHEKLQVVERQAFEEGQKVAAGIGALPLDEYEQRLSEYWATVQDINQSDLAAYVARRKVTLDLLQKLIAANELGKYSREDAIHSLLMPMRADSNAVGPDGSNLWIIDESLAFHDYLASDIPLTSIQVTGSDSATRPDLLATRILDAPFLAAEGTSVPLPSIVVVELKRPMRNDADEGEDPIGQTLSYVKRVRDGGIKTSTGRPIPKTVDAPAFCYVIADLTAKMVARCELANLQPTHDGMGYFGYNTAAKAYVEVMSYDRLLNSATQRNRAFFDKLGLPST